MTNSRAIVSLATVLALCLTACSNSSAPDAAAPAGAAGTQAAAQSVDAELEKLKTVQPVVACELLTVEDLAAVFAGLKFEPGQQLAPQMSGYAWDSRCEYRAGVGTMEFAKDTPTHVVQIFVSTVVDEAKAQANLKSRAETAVSTSNYTARPELGASAYTVSSVGYVSAFLTKGQAEIQLNTSDMLQSTYDEKVAKVLALAKGL